MALIELSITHRLRFLEWLYFFDVERFREYFQKVRVHFDESQAKIEMEFRKTIVGEPSVDEEVYKQFELEKQRHQEDFPNILRSSFYTATYAHFEQTLFRACRIVQAAKSFPFQVNEIQGKGINQARHYLEMVAGLDMGSRKEIWMRIQFYAEVRNKIVHNGGGLNALKDEAFILKAKSYPSFKISGQNWLDLTDEACHESLFYYEKYINDLSQDLLRLLVP